ncbi:c-PI de-N-acetylase, putative [Babesia ovata]|uniref:C-PI de-N-acetylase, putative n=1 Tax=Babesia ovata TaxID=189622 RepID=A0A2H6K7F7_9APIC|nr:c-PI de-N-acetylase, putative [Babesia ovata]GBE58925.1 c-PI de-N-acetylase, putative [Babesia ovata]
MTGHRTAPCAAEPRLCSSLPSGGASTCGRPVSNPANALCCSSETGSATYRSEERICRVGRMGGWVNRSSMSGRPGFPIGTILGGGLSSPCPRGERADVLGVGGALVAHDDGGQLRWLLDLLQRAEVQLRKRQHGLALEAVLLVLQPAALDQLLVVLGQLGELALVADHLVLVVAERLQRLREELEIVREVLVVVCVQNVEDGDVLRGAVEHVLAEEALREDGVLDHDRHLDQDLRALEVVEVLHVALRVMVHLEQLVRGAVGLERDLASARHRVEAQHDSLVNGLLVNNQVVDDLLGLHIPEVQRLVPSDGEAVDVDVVQQVRHLVLVLHELLVRLFLQLLLAHVGGALVTVECVVDVALLREREAVGDLELVAEGHAQQLAVDRHRVVVLAVLKRLDEREAVYLDSDDFLDYDYDISPLSTGISVPVFDISDSMSMAEPSYREYKRESNRISDDALNAMRDEYYAKSCITASAYDQATFYKLQAEILVSKRKYKEALCAALVAERAEGRSRVIDAVKMICMYQLNDEERFKELKQELTASGLGGLSETLKKQALGTIEVSNWVPEFLNCLDQMKQKTDV